MHGRLQPEGENCRVLRKRSTQHMRSVLPLANIDHTLTAVGEHQSFLASSVTTAPNSDSFFKNGREISVGDCALFKPPRDTPPFIGLIRWVTLSKDNILQLGVNWLYRPAELKLGKGSLVDSAPNEVFYSFHRDETPAASLLHPCKVAFLPGGVELPTGTSSFVCRRVYDIANKCLWWLTDQNFINERQVEVNQLLYRTKLEMHATLQPGGRSPKQLNGPTSTSELKPASDGGQNSGNYSSQIKGKKRERGDYCSDPVKRECSSRTYDGDTIQCKIENDLKPEISRITEKGGLVDLEGVDKLVQLMRPDRIERKLDLVCRTMLARVIAATDKGECLNQFMKLGGLPVLDEWLQDIRKGKIGDGSSRKDNDKSVEEFVLILLRALDKLPVNLQALQMCNIGRSVNHLRTHKNIEIHRKARALVDTWKRRVQAEMISIDAKSGSTQDVSAWPSRQHLPEANHGENRTLSGSDVAIKSSITQVSASKTTSTRSSHGDNNNLKSTSSPRPVKQASSPSPGKESQSRLSATGTPDAPVVREDRSSSSNQSPNYCPSFTGREDVKSSTPGSVAANKVSGCSTRNRKTSGYPGLSATGNQKETNSGRSSSAPRSNTMEKVSQSASCSERVSEGPVTGWNNHKLIVKIPNRVRSPAHVVSGGSVEDPICRISQTSSSVPVEKHELLDCIAKDKSDGYHCNVATDMKSESRQKIESNDAVVRSGGAGSPVTSHEEHSMATEDSRKLEGAPTNQPKLEKLHTSLSGPMNAFVENCVKGSEANSSSLEDDGGMNLLATVAAGEMSRSELVSPTDSTERSTPAAEEVYGGDEAKSKSSEVMMEGVQRQLHNDAECDDKKQAVIDGCSGFEDALNMSKHALCESSADRKSVAACTSEDIPVGESNKHADSSSKDLISDFERKCVTSDKLYKKTGSTSSTDPTSMEKIRDGKSEEEMQAKSGSGNISNDGIANCSGNESNVVFEKKGNTDLLTIEKNCKNVEGAASIQSEVDCRKDTHEGIGTEKRVKSEMGDTSGNEKLHQTRFQQKSLLETVDDIKDGESDEKDVKHCVVKPETLTPDKDRDADGENSGAAGFCSALHDVKSHHEECNGGNKEILEHDSVKSETQQKSEFRESNSSCNEQEEAEVSAPTVAEASPSIAGLSDLGAKVKFDLNEGFSADDGKYVEPLNLSSGMENFQLNSLPSSINSFPSSHSASITVAAAAKGPFVPPENLLRSRRELGWKGSAATSAFRPAEPRKILETALAPINGSSSDASTGNQGRVLLDIDLNVPDERVLEELAARDSASAVDSSNFLTNHTFLHEAKEAPVSVSVCFSGGLDLDLNRIDEVHNNGQSSTSSNRKGEGSVVHIKPLSRLPTGDIRRGFDLNNGPGVDDSNAEQLFSMSPQVKGAIPSQFLSAGLRMNSPGLESFSSWFPPGNTFSTLAVPSSLPDRGEQAFPVLPPNAPQRAFGPSGVTAINPNVYRGSLLSSSPAVPFQPGPFQFPGFPFGATFPLPSATFSIGPSSYAEPSSGPRLFAPPINSQLLGPVATVTAQSQRPCVVGLHDSSSNGGIEHNRNWGRQGLDLNAGPGFMESEAREDMLPLPSRQNTVANAQSLLEEHARIYSVSGGVLKRKEPEGGWDTENFRFKQSS